MRMPEKACCKAHVQKRIDVALGQGLWSARDGITARCLALVRGFTPNRFPEVTAGTFAVARAQKPFQGFANLTLCPTCNQRHDVCIIDARLIELTFEIVTLLELCLDAATSPPLTFRPINKQDRATAKEIVKSVLFRTEIPKTADPYAGPKLEANAFLNEFAFKSVLFAIIHETSHMGPGEALGRDFSGATLKSISAYTDAVGASEKQARAWADELATDFNAFNMIHLAPFGPGRNHTADRQAAWDDQLLCGATLTLKIVQIMQRAVYPELPGLSVAQQLATVRHPPASWRLLLFWHRIDMMIQQGAIASGPWHLSARNLANHIDQLFGLPRLTAA